jgi:hypothetical protein
MRTTGVECRHGWHRDNRGEFAERESAPSGAGAGAVRGRTHSPRIRTLAGCDARRARGRNLATVCSRAVVSIALARRCARTCRCARAAASKHDGDSRAAEAVRWNKVTTQGRARSRASICRPSRAHRSCVLAKVAAAYGPSRGHAPSVARRSHTQTWRDRAIGRAYCTVIVANFRRSWPSLALAGVMGARALPLNRPTQTVYEPGGIAGVNVMRRRSRMR